MKFEIERASEVFQGNRERPCPNAELIGKDSYGQNVWSIEIDTLEDLIALGKRCKCGLVLGFRNDEEDINHITIYDGYIE